MSMPPLPEPVASKTWPQSLTGEPGFTVPLFTDDQMLAYAAQAVAESADELAEWRKLRDPAVLHANLMRGIPAQLDSATFLHLAGECAIAQAVAEAVEAEREACAVACTDYAKRHAKDDDDSKARAWMMLQCAAAIRARSTASASHTKGDKPALESAPDASSAPCR